MLSDDLRGTFVLAKRETRDDRDPKSDLVSEEAAG